MDREPPTPPLVDHGTEFITAVKCTRDDGTDYRTGKVLFSPGLTIEVAADDAGPCDCLRKHLGPCPVGVECGKGIHVSPLARQACAYIKTAVRGQRARFFEVSIAASDVLGRGRDKYRCRKLLVVREIPFAEVFPNAADWPARVAAVRLEIASWKGIQWMKPAQPVTETVLRGLFETWRSRMLEFQRPGRPELPAGFLVVRTPAAADAAADADAADADAADADAAAAAADADAADADAADADAAAAAADADAADAAAAAADDAAAAADDAAAAADDAAAAADDAAAAAAAAAARPWPYWVRWYLRPSYVLWRLARWEIYIGPERPNPWQPIAEMYRLGCRPIGYRVNRETGATEFVVYAPDPA